MRANSAPVQSNQSGPHEDLQAVVCRHLEHAWRAPGHAPTERVFQEWISGLSETDRARPLILDAGCGTGASTRQLAAMHPEALVLGVDQSAARLDSDDGNLEHISAHACLLRARVEFVWRGLRAMGMRVAEHYLWYPNPWPKSAHLQRRWHGHPAWPDLLQVTEQLELRSNWQIYVAEFALALERSGWQASLDEVLPGEAAVSPFERKYRESGHRLYRLRARPG